MRFGAIEAGGTKFVCGIGNQAGEIEERVQFPTGRPEETLERASAFFRGRDVAAIGVGSFGPLDLDRESPTYGCVTTTPKPGWSGYDFVGTLRSALDVPIGFDTDVNAAALGEATWGAAQGLNSCAYYTIGTGIGVGVYVEGRLVHGLVHPEAGHVLTRRHPKDEFAGICPYHGDCLEGLAAGPALQARWGVNGSELPADHPAWEIEAYYLGQSIAGTMLTLSPKKVILGGGVMKQDHLFPLIRMEVRKSLNGYIRAAAVMNDIDGYIVPPGLGEHAGLAGALVLGMTAWQQHNNI
ncbi:ROK family protein [Paenibacillus sp.]|uniref:ROK family protein n=1 Tax=Paenibacillus sp. TaxID=58172 RepID=UPI002811DD7E|nr:ROK family protein [Paenibacillus sp.]